ncbi:MAG: methylated-DNA--[protein]-cysteine S-methyltransferase [Thermoanaerobaculia bacterium]|nr:methylated-DNA--[protein]-cysteine S-methyltransferase [Thermoanaerobaculia bacterium]
MPAVSSRAQLTFASPIGRLRVSTMANAEGSAQGARLVEVKLRAPELPNSGTGEVLRLAEEARRQILDFLEGERHVFDLPFQLAGSPFQQQVLRKMSRVAFGRRITYGDLAKQVGDPGASRAVGAVCGANPVPLVVPCHRIVARDGLGGFGGGLDMKRWLLTYEATGKVPAPLDDRGRRVGIAGSSSIARDVESTGLQLPLF